MTKETPTCAWCKKRLRPDYKVEWIKKDVFDPVTQTHFIDHKPVKTGGIRGYGYANDGVFCTLRCGYLFGLWAVGMNLAEAQDPHLAHCHTKQTGYPEDCNCR